MFQYLQVTSTARHQTIKVPFTAPGKKRSTDPTPLCSWSKQTGKNRNYLSSHTLKKKKKINLLKNFTTQFVLILVTRMKFPVSRMLTGLEFTVRMLTARIKKKSIAFLWQFIYTATPVWRLTPSPSTWERLVCCFNLKLQFKVELFSYT